MPTSIDPRRPRWLAGGRQIAYIRPGQEDPPSEGSQQGVEVEIIELDTGQSRTIQLPGTWRQRHQLNWSPDEHFVAYVDRESNQSTSSQLWLYRMTDGEAFPVSDSVSWNESPSWSPDGRTLYFVSNREGLRDLWQQRLSADGAREGEPVRVTAGLGLWRAALSPDGTRLAYVPGGWISNIWRVPILADRVAGWGDAEPLTFGRHWIGALALSNDGTRLAIASERDGNMDIWVLPSTGGEPQQLTGGPAVESLPSWSPDDQELAFLSAESGSRQLWTIPSGGGPARQLTSFSDRIAFFPDWSPDGSAVVYRSADAVRNVRLEVIDVATGVSRVLNDVPGGTTPNWSPDGRQILFVRTGDIRRIMQARSGDSEVITAGVTPHWSSNGQRIYFQRQLNEPEPTIWTRSLDDGAERQLANLSARAGEMAPYSFDTDGEWLYFAWRENQGDIWVMDVVQDEQ